METNFFYVEYERRIQQERMAKEKPTVALTPEDEEYVKVKEKIGVSVELTEEATSFLANVAVRKEKAKSLQQATHCSKVVGNVFQSTGDLKKQHLVISEALSKMDVYDLIQ